jgi:hypothetical protein
VLYAERIVSLLSFCLLSSSSSPFSFFDPSSDRRSSKESVFPPARRVFIEREREREISPNSLSRRHNHARRREKRDRESERFLLSRGFLPPYTRAQHALPASSLHDIAARVRIVLVGVSSFFSR